MMLRGGQVPAGLSDGDRGRARDVLKWFNAMATETEKTLLKRAPAGAPVPDEGERLRVSERLHTLVCDRLADGWLQNGHDVPRELAKGNLPAGGVSSRIRGLAAAEAACEDRAERDCVCVVASNVRG